MTELRAHANAAAILARNAFDSISGPFRRSISPSIPPLARHDVDPLFAPACSAPRLVIVSESPDPSWSVAAFRVTDSAQAEVHRIGERVMGQRIEFIGFNPVERSPAVWLSSPGKLCQALLFASRSPTTDADSELRRSTESLAVVANAAPNTIASKIRQLSDNEYEIDRSAVLQIMSDGVELTRSLRVVPETRDGKTVGVRVFGIRAGSLPALLGLQNADLLESVNDFSMATPEGALQAYAQLSRASTLDVRLERRGAPLALLIHIR